MKATDLRGILGYMARFRDRLFVLNIDSAVLLADNFRNLLLDVSVLRSLNINVLIVHGASQRIKKLSGDLHVAASDLEGMGVTDEPTLELAILAASRFSHDILEGLAETDMRAAVTNAIVAHPAGIRRGKDYAWTGKVEKIDTAFLIALLKEGIIPIVPPLGFDGNGQTYRVNSDQVALEVATELKAAKLMFISTRSGVRDADHSSAHFSVLEVEDYLKKNRATLPPDMVSKLEHGLRACKNGVQRAHIINGLEDEALLSEVFSNEGVGTMIYANEYQAIRPARKKDVSAITSLIREAVAAEELVGRTRKEVSDQIESFHVFEIDRNIVGCVGLQLYPEERIAELQCLYVTSSHENQGVGTKLMQFVEERARSLGVRQLLALSTQAFNYFQQKGGFREGTPALLPPDRLKKYELSGRKSKVLVKDLTAG